MVDVIALTPLLVILIPLCAGLLIYLSDQRPNLRETWSVAAGILQFLAVISMAPTVLSGQTISYPLYTFLPGLNLALRVDSLGLSFATIASFLWILTSFYSIGYMRGTHEHRQTRYFVCFALAISATLGVAFSVNLLTLYIFYELLSLVTVPLVGHKETAESSAGAKKYLLYLAGASKTALLAAIVLTYSIAGTLDFTPGGLFTELAGTTPKMLTIVYILFIFGFAKAALMPLHAWLPAAMVAPTPVSALLHAVAVVKVGVFSVLRVIFHVFGVDLMGQLGLGEITLFLASYTILMASIYALTRDNLKARLAYSTVSQLSYIILGGALLTPSGMIGGITHIASHAFSKITLFFSAGSIYVATHKTKISEMGGIGRQMPWTMAAFTIGTFGMIGVPPVSGFVSKWYLAIGSIEAQNIPTLIVLLSSTLLNAAYFLPIVYKAFWGCDGHGEQTATAVGVPTVGHGGPDSFIPTTTADIVMSNGSGPFTGGGAPPQSLGAAAAHDPEDVREAPFVVVPLVITAICSVLLGLFPQYFLELAKGVIQ